MLEFVLCLCDFLGFLVVLKVNNCLSVKLFELIYFIMVFKRVVVLKKFLFFLLVIRMLVGGFLIIWIIFGWFIGFGFILGFFFILGCRGVIGMFIGVIEVVVVVCFNRLLVIMLFCIDIGMLSMLLKIISVFIIIFKNSLFVVWFFFR